MPEKKKYYSNGFLVKCINKDWHCQYPDNYGGLSGNMWPINSKYEETLSKEEAKILEDYVQEHIEIEWKCEPNYEYVYVCADIPFLNHYIDACKRAGYEIDILFLMSKISLPICEYDIEKSKELLAFLGFDYGYIDFSCLYNYVGRVPELSDYSINKYGLLETEDEIIRFGEQVEYLRSNKLAKLELGRNHIYKIWRYIGQYPINEC